MQYPPPHVPVLVSAWIHIPAFCPYKLCISSLGTQVWLECSCCLIHTVLCTVLPTLTAIRNIYMHLIPHSYCSNVQTVLIILILPLQHSYVSPWSYSCIIHTHLPDLSAASFILISLILQLYHSYSPPWSYSCIIPTHLPDLTAAAFILSSLILQLQHSYSPL